jgi:phosphohistidine swiveling domain-containing protein
MSIAQCNSKAKTLEYLQTRVSIFKVPELVIIPASRFIEEASPYLDSIQKIFGDKTLVIRSSASDEDGLNSAMAGEYDSVLNVLAIDRQAVHNAIDTVIKSYSRKGPRNGGDEIIVQEMVLDSCMSGVVFTHDLNTGAPYYVINYDDVSGLTNTVTSGDGEYSNRTLYIHREALDALRSERFQRLIEAVLELEQVMATQFLDIEFAMAQDLTPYLLQVRAITTQPNWNRAVSKRINASLAGIQSFVRKRLEPMPGVYGSTTVLGQMPDWNPAEMIGRAPRALAYSLYKSLITDDAWRIARKQMGYAVPVGQPLMVSLAGQPFIDTRLSFHSYLPEGLPSELCQKLVNAWVYRLKDKPELHDKVEFEVAITTYSFDFEKKIENLIPQVLSESEQALYKNALKAQLNHLINTTGEGGIADAISKADQLTDKHRRASHRAEMSELSALYELMDDCINLGTVPFSILARHGFIARTLLLSLVDRDILTAGEAQQFQTGIRTVASELVDDMHLLQVGKLERNEFMVKYGHLRPGTYDILSRRYDQMPELGVQEAKAFSQYQHTSYGFSEETRRRIDELLLAEGFNDICADSLIQYIRAAIIGREYGKFVFTQSVSEILELIAKFGEAHGLSREEMSHIPLERLLETASCSLEGNIEEKLRAIAEEEAEKHAISVAIRLPQVLFDEAGVHIVPFQVSHPNFITQGKITAPIFSLRVSDDTPDLHGKIVLIENADPGFDWIFSQSIAGLITKYGGANSHMAIRCAEFGIPAAIGCGEQRFELLLKAHQVSLDCAAGLINPLH